MIKKSLIIACSMVALISIGCAASSGIVSNNSEKELGLRKTDLYSEGTDTIGAKTDYSRPAPGASKKFERAYLDAPPMIPHSVEGLLPITQSNNACLGCHMPEVAPSLKATAIPASHFANFRPATGMAADGKITKEGKAVDNTSDFKTVAHKMDKLNPARFNCSQCHAPQAKVKLAIQNHFNEVKAKRGF